VAQKLFVKRDKRAGHGARAKILSRKQLSSIIDFMVTKKPLEIQWLLRWVAEGASARGIHSPTLQHYRKTVGRSSNRSLAASFKSQPPSNKKPCFSAGVFIAGWLAGQF